MEPYTIFQLGDQAITFSLSNRINRNDHERITAMNEWIRKNSFPGILDIIVAYSSLTIIYDAYVIKKSQPPTQFAFDFVSENLKSAYQNTERFEHQHVDKLIQIPVCYEDPFSPDLHFISDHNKIDSKEVIELHVATIYRVYMIGFLPGFPYMAEVDKKIAAPRKEKPSPKIIAGSVGIAGIQTGIYPVDSPGGWQIIGRTPIKMFDKNSTPPSKLEPGNRVQFYPISKSEFENFLCDQ